MIRVAEAAIVTKTGATRTVATTAIALERDGQPYLLTFINA
jgi:hypothetical protein